VLSECGRYRYELRRRIGEHDREVCWVMLNPSTADHRADDPTIRKVVGFSRRWGYDLVRVVNLYAVRATKPKDMKLVRDPKGALNAKYVVSALENCEKVVVAWGRQSKWPESGGDWFVKTWAFDNGVDLWCLGTCADGAPVHPLMIGYDRELVKWQ